MYVLVSDFVGRDNLRTPTWNVTFPSIESSVINPLAVFDVLDNRTWELMLSGSDAPQGDQIVEVKGIWSEIS
jgi:hypothetical protein